MVDERGEAGPFDVERDAAEAHARRMGHDRPLEERAARARGLPDPDLDDTAAYWRGRLDEAAVRGSDWRRMPDGTDPTPSVAEQLAADWTLSDTELGRALRANRTPEGSAAKRGVTLPGRCARQPPHPFCINDTGSEGRLAPTWLCGWCAERDGAVGGWQNDPPGGGSVPRVVRDVTYRSRSRRATPDFGQPSGLFIAPFGTPLEWQISADVGPDDVIITTERKTMTVTRDEPFQPYDWTRDPEAAADFGGQMASSADAEKTTPRMPRDPHEVPTLREHLQASGFSHREREHIVALVHRWLTQNTEAGYGFDGTELLAELERK